MVKDRAQAIDVRPLIQGLDFAPRLLRSHVLRRANDIAGQGGRNVGGTSQSRFPERGRRARHRPFESAGRRTFRGSECRAGLRDSVRRAALGRAAYVLREPPVHD